MREPHLYEEIIRRVKQKLAGPGNPQTEISRRVVFILQRYLNYATEALINGYPITIRFGPQITLEMEETRPLEKKEEGIWLTSDRVFGYMFRLNLKRGFIHPDYIWYPDKQIMNRLQKALDSDIIYELIKT
jgi:hypothetical protein